MIPAPPGLHAGDVYERIFVTSSKYSVTSDTSVPPLTGVFGGLAAADYQVTLSAYQAGLIPDWNGHDILWHAILSTSTVDARDRVSVPGPVYNTQNELIATSFADLWDGAIAHPVRYDESGVEVLLGSRVWTGSNALGQNGGLQNANDWTNPSAQASTADPNRSDGGWLASGQRTANVVTRLYAFSDPITVVPEPSSFIMLGLGAAGLLLAARRRRA
jgi:hypothetical protein